jgi:hypothetical protein
MALYQAAQDAEQHNWADFGVQMGLLLQQLRASGLAQISIDTYRDLSIFTYMYLSSL